MRDAQKKSLRACRTTRGFTLVELMLALAITAMIGAAIVTLIVGSLNTDRFLRSTNASQSEIELAVDRISNNVREAQTGSIVVGTSSLTTLTQSDLADGYASGASVVYSLSPDATTATQNDLMENDPRYGNNVLVHNVNTFTITQVAGVTGLYQIDLVVGSQMTEERHFKIFNRN